jgi:hypothetical protein
LKFYDAQPLPASSVADDWTRTMMEKVYTLAAETALPVDDYKAWFKSFSADTVLKGMDKVCICVFPLFAYSLLSLTMCNSYISRINQINIATTENQLVLTHRTVFLTFQFFSLTFS